MKHYSRGHVNRFFMQLSIFVQIVCMKVKGFLHELNVIIKVVFTREKISVLLDILCECMEMEI